MEAAGINSEYNGCLTALRRNNLRFPCTRNQQSYKAVSYPCLWFDGNAKEAAKFYCPVFKDGYIRSEIQTKFLTFKFQILTNMKKIILLFAVLLSVPALGQTKEDTLAIRKATLDYIEGWASGNVERIHNSVSPELSKRRVATAGDLVYVQDMSHSLLCASALGNAKGVRMPDLTPGKELSPEIKILDIDGTNASVKTWNAKYGFFDYIHLSKTGGKWLIINVLWDMNSR